MSEENKEKPFETPMVPIFGLNVARELGAIDSRLGRVETGIDRVEIKVDGLGSRLDRVEIRLDQLESDNREIKQDLKALDAKTDKMAYALNRLDERTRLMMVLGGGILIAVIAGIILQLFSK